jgi:hypothetical protein
MSLNRPQLEQRGAQPSCVQGFFPPVDDEYIEYADALQSVAEVCVCVRVLIYSTSTG